MVHVNKKSMKKLFSKNQNLDGFTLIELLVATTLFTIIAVGGISVLLSAQRAYKRISENRIAVDNVNLVLNNMSREIKFGTNYKCANPDTTQDFTYTNFYLSPYIANIDSLSSNNNGICNAIIFTPANSTTTKVVYYLKRSDLSVNEADYELNEDKNSFTKKLDVSITGSGFSINDFNLAIFGTGADDNLQPKVKILISGLITTNRNNQNGTVSTSTFTVQQVVSQRIFDN
jgi:prepilin-type N-terminal cleavage/methylation domain-containing protein